MVIQATDETVAKLEDTVDCSDSIYVWDRNVTSYLWNEMPGDFPTSGWCMENNQGQLSELSSLTLKAKACTPALKRFVLLFCSQRSCNTLRCI